LSELVDKRYLRTLPYDPIADSYEAWVITPSNDGQEGGVYNINSGAEGAGANGVPYAEW
jgi:general secretion pathway protein G